MSATEIEPTPKGWRLRLGVGQPMGRLFLIQGLHSAAESMFAISLAGSLFFSVTLDASRSRILLYLALTLAPFAILGPLIGPFIDRVRGGHRIVLATTLTGRALAAALLSEHIQGLWLYPLAFAILVFGRTYSVTRNAIVPTFAGSNDRLVGINSTLALVGTVCGAVASAVGVAVLNFGDAGWVLRLAVVPYTLGALLSLALHDPDRAAHIGVEDIVEIAAPAIRSAASAMGALRTAAGFMTFHLAFTLKRGGDPTWFFGVVIAANSVGSMLGTLASPWLRRHLSEHQMLTLAMAGPASVATIAALRFHQVTMVALAFVVGLGMSVGRRAFDSVVQTHAPHGSRGSAYATLETRLELSWVAGALVAVAARAAGWIGMVALATGLAVTVILRLGVHKLQRRLETLWVQEPLPRRLLLTAERFADMGDDQQAVIMVGAAADAALVHPDTPSAALKRPDVIAAIERIGGIRTSVMGGASADAGEAIAVATALLLELGFVVHEDPGLTVEVAGPDVVHAEEADTEAPIDAQDPIELHQGGECGSADATEVHGSRTQR